MSSSLPWFHARQLASTMLQHLDEAVRCEAISVGEHAWLSALPAGEKSAALPEDMHVRVLANADPAPFSGLMISHRDLLKPATYFYSPLTGIAPYYTDAELYQALQDGTLDVGINGHTAKWIAVAEPPFRRWMRAIIQARQHRLERLNGKWQRLPALREVLDTRLTQAMRSALPASDPILPGSHCVQRLNSADDSVINLQTLSDHAMDLLTGHDAKVVYLGVYGAPLSAADDALYRSTVAATVATLADNHVQALVEFWAAKPRRSKLTRQAHLSLNLRHSYLSAVLDAQAQQRCTVEQATLLISVAGTKPSATLSLEALVFNPPAPNDTPLPWPCTLIIGDKARPEWGFFIYSTDAGLEHCPDLAALGTYFNRCVSAGATSSRLLASEQALFNAQVLPQPKRVALAGSTFDTLAMDIVRLQQRRLRATLASKKTLGDNPLLRVAEAVDLRGLVHPQLQWLAVAAPATSSAAATASPSTATPSESWLLQLDGLQRQLIRQRKATPALSQDIAQQLALPLLAFGSPLPGDKLYVRIMAAPTTTMSLIDYLLDRTSGATTATLTDRDEVLDAAGKPLPWPDISQLEALVQQQYLAVPGALLRAFNTRGQAPSAFHAGSYQLHDQRRALREQALRLDLALARRAGTLDSGLLDCLSTALDRPAAALRNATDIDVHGVFCKLADELVEIPLTNVFIVHRHSKPKGTVLLWSSMEGLSTFTSLQQLKRTIAAGLAHPMARERWLKGVQANWSKRLDTLNETYGDSSIEIITHAITGDFVARLEAMESLRRAECLRINTDLAITCGFSHGLFKRDAEYVRTDDALATVSIRLGVEVANAQLLELLPAWILKATEQQLARYIEVLYRYTSIATGGENFMAGIPSLDAFSRERLRKTLQADWPDGAHNPDRVLIKLTTNSGGGVSVGGGIALGDTRSTTKTLTQWAIDQFGGSQSGQMTITLDPPSLTLATPSTYQVRTVVSEADVGGAYRKLLAEKLAPGATDFAERRRLYTRALPAQMMRYALECQLQGTLSEGATRMIEQVMEMPDALAREPLQGQHISLGPLGLIADTDAPPDIACGMHLIAPDDLHAGPVVLYTAYGESATLLEYANRAALLTQIKADSKLQDVIMSRLPEQARSVYAKGGFAEPHVPWTTEVPGSGRLGGSPVLTLLHRPHTGNALYYLFDDNIQLIQLIARRQTLSAGEATWDAFCLLVKLGLEQGSLMLPNPLGRLVAVFQAQALLLDSAKALDDRKWGEALADLVAAMASLIGARRSASELAAERDMEGLDQIRTSSRQAQYGSSMDSLRDYEVGDLALTDLTHDPLLNLYHSADGLHTYASVRGKVIEVRRGEDGWVVASQRGDGPRLALLNEKWQLDPGIARMGAASSLSDRYETWVTEENLVDVFMPQAKGATQIRAYYPRHHQMIINAHAHSVTCLRNTLVNLHQATPHLPLPDTVNAILSEVFEVDVSPATLFQLRTRCASMLNELTSPALDPQTSARYWAGLNHAGHETTHAFIWETDPQKRIFLTEAFFNLPADTWLYSSHQRGLVQLYAHHQAASLLHELSHQVLQTVDLAYMDSFMPLIEHYDDSNGVNSPAQLYARSLQRVRQEALSLSTPLPRLFTRPGSNGRRDFRSSDGRQRETVLTLSNKPTLAQARTVFRSDAEARARIIMANADSMTLLILRLGQQLLN